MGFFISIEGGEGTGKTQQAGVLTERLRALGRSVIPVREPGTTEIGKYLRDWLKSKRAISYGTELLLFAAARSELVETVIKPSISHSNTIIVADRYADSTTAYQGYGRQLNLAYVDVINKVATQNIWPNLTILLDIDPEMALRRLGPFQMGFKDGSEIKQGSPRLDSEGQRRFEEEDMKFHKRVRDGYRKLAQDEPQRWLVVDASATVEKVAETIWGKVSNLLTVAGNSPVTEALETRGP